MYFFSLIFNLSLWTFFAFWFFCARVIFTLEPVPGPLLRAAQVRGRVRRGPAPDRGPGARLPAAAGRRRAPVRPGTDVGGGGRFAESGFQKVFHVYRGCTSIFAHKTRSLVVG